MTTRGEWCDSIMMPSGQHPVSGCKSITIKKVSFTVCAHACVCLVCLVAQTCVAGYIWSGKRKEKKKKTPTPVLQMRAELHVAQLARRWSRVRIQVWELQPVDTQTDRVES